MRVVGRERCVLDIGCLRGAGCVSLDLTVMARESLLFVERKRSSYGCDIERRLTITDLDHLTNGFGCVSGGVAGLTFVVLCCGGWVLLF